MILAESELGFSGVKDVRLVVAVFQKLPITDGVTIHSTLRDSYLEDLDYGAVAIETTACTQ